MPRRTIWRIAWGAAALLLAMLLAFAVKTMAMLDTDKLTSFSQSTVLYDRNDEQAAVLSGAENRTAVALEDVPLLVRQAFVAAEDARFYRHHGVDFYRIGGALLHNIKTGDYSQGASTITQQLVKLTHLTSVKSIERKAREALLALRLEMELSKDEILECYLNTVYFGAGAYGIEAASRAYFGIPSSGLSLSQGALLAAIIKSPSKYAPHLNEEAALDRRNLVLGLMAEQGYISPERAEEARLEPIRILEREDAGVKYAWYAEQAASEAASILGIDYEGLLSGGYHLYTALNTDMQLSAQALFEDADNFPPDASDGVQAQAALACCDCISGEVLCLIGGRDYTVQRGLNRASSIRRQPGSALKPVSVYASAVDRFGYLPTSFIDDTPRDFGGGYVPGNLGGKYYGLVTLREALSRSLNVATVDLMSRTGVNSAMQYARGAGLELDAADANLSMALGALTHGVSPMALGAAYAPLANGGQSVEPHLIRRIEDAEGQTLYVYHDEARQALSETSARLITDMLLTAADTGSARALGQLSFPVAGKTGTVGEESGNRDVWTVAYTPKCSVCVWMGFDQPDAGHALSNQVTGSSHPSRLAAAFLNENAAFAEGGEFKLPPTLSRVLIDRRALEEKHQPMLLSALTPKSYAQAELFPASLSPKRVSDVWRAPSRVFDLKAGLCEGGARLTFTAVDDYALYRLYKTGEGEPPLLAELSGSAGESLTYVDYNYREGDGYYIVPCEKVLLGEGVELSAPPSDAAFPGRTEAKKGGPLPDIAREEPLF